MYIQPQELVITNTYSMPSKFLMPMSHYNEAEDELYLFLEPIHKNLI
jgi:hypothetical protein